MLKVCDATSIIGLSRAGEFHILKEVLGEIDEALKKAGEFAVGDV